MTEPAGRRFGLHPMSVAAAAVAALIVAVLVVVTGVVNSRTQERLLHVQTAAAGLVLGDAVPSIRTPLTTAAAVAEAGHGNTAEIRKYVQPAVGARRGARFRKLSVWRLGATGPVRLLRLGAAGTTATPPNQVEAIARRVSGPERLVVIPYLHGPHPTLAYAVESIGAAPRYLVLGWSQPLAADRHAHVPASSAFHDLHFALYLGKRPSSRDLLEATLPRPSGSVSSVTIPFGTSELELVASARSPLGGGILPVLPWIIGVGGAFLAVAAAVLTEWLSRRRRTAEELARENQRLYAAQRSISQSLQQALLPKSLPSIPGIEFSARYVAGDPSADVGGDWYDVIGCDDHSCVFAVGDVSGRGVPAASTMASLHYAIRAYAAQGDGPLTILEKLGALLDVARDGHFATVLLGHADVARHEVTVVSAGHPPPLVVGGGDGHFVETLTGAPVGVWQRSRYTPVTFTVPPRGSMLAYTDGLVERRGEMLDTGLERLRVAATSGGHAPHGLIDAVLGSLTTEGAMSDDVALLELRWTS